jgi:16S rRNA (uracil1498-N3)-methyltransferase
MAAPWFFVEAIPPVGAQWPLPREEAKHAAGAKRLSAGDPVVLFNGRGSVADGSLGGERLRDGSIPVMTHAVRQVERSLPRVHLATALPKGDRLGTLIDMVTQLGVASVTPLRCDRSVVGDSEARGDRMRRIMVESCKQARVAWLPTLHAERSLDEMLRAPHAGPIVALHPGGTSLARLLGGERGHPPELTMPELTIPELTILVGPEGGFTDREIEACARANALRASLGESILRVETAAVVAVATARLSGERPACRG